MRHFIWLLLVGLASAGCRPDRFEPFEFFYSINSQKAVILSLLPVTDGVQLRKRVYPEDGEIGVGEVAAEDQARLLTDAETAEVQALFQAVDFAALDDGDYIPPLEASLWAINTTDTGDDYHTVLEPGEDSARRHLTELVALGSYLWRLAGLDGDFY